MWESVIEDATNCTPFFVSAQIALSPKAVVKLEETDAEAPWLTLLYKGFNARASVKMYCRKAKLNDFEYPLISLRWINSDLYNSNNWHMTQRQRVGGSILNICQVCFCFSVLSPQIRVLRHWGHDPCALLREAGPGAWYSACVRSQRKAWEQPSWLESYPRPSSARGLKQAPS